MSVRRSRYQPRRIHYGATVTMAVFFAVAFLVVLLIVGSPRLLLRAASARVPVLPSWLFCLGFFVFFAIAGAALGAVLFQHGQWRDTAKYKGAFFLSIAVVASYLWYAVTVGAHFFLPSILLAAVAMTFFAPSSVNFRCVFRPAAWGMGISALWAGYLLVLSVRLFFSL